MTVEPYAGPPTDSWVAVIAPVGDLAQKIAGTEFVPEGLRGKPAAVAAAILVGRELGLGPMTALAGIDVIKGKPGLSAHLMRAMVLAAGHELRWVETTDARCVLEGRRAGTEDWTRVIYTADSARSSGIRLGDYPQDKLAARATTRLCRRLFADVIAGMAYEPGEGVEELPGSESPPASPQRRTARRGATVTPLRAEEPAQIEPSEPSEPVQPDRPPLPGDPEPGPAGAQQALPVPDEPTPEEPPQPASSDGPEVSNEQLGAIAASLADMAITDRGDRLLICTTLAGREQPLTTGKDLTRIEASAVLDTLARVKALPDPEHALSMLVGLGQVPRAEIVQVLGSLEDEATA